MDLEKARQNREDIIAAEVGDVFMTPNDFRIEVNGRVGDVLDISTKYVGRFANVTPEGALGPLATRMTVAQLIQAVNS